MDFMLFLYLSYIRAIGQNKKCCSDSNLCCYLYLLLVAIVQKDMQLERSTYEVLQIMSISLTDKTHLRYLFDKTKFQKDKEQAAMNSNFVFINIEFNLLNKNKQSFLSD